MNLIDVGYEEGVLRVFLDPMLMKAVGGVLGIAIAYLFYRFIKPAVSAHVQRNKKKYLTVAYLVLGLASYLGINAGIQFNSQRVENNLRQSLPPAWYDMFKMLETMDSNVAKLGALKAFLQGQSEEQINYKGLDYIVCEFAVAKAGRKSLRPKVVELVQAHVISSPIADIRTDGLKLASYDVPMSKLAEVELELLVYASGGVPVK